MRMKSLIFVGFISLSVGLLAQATDQNTVAGKAEPTRRSTAKLADGSSIIGTPLFEALPTTCTFADVTIPVSLLRHATFTTNSVKLAFTNGDTLTGTPNFNTLPFETSFGKIDLALAMLRDVSFTTAFSPYSAKDGLVYWCTFDSETDILTPAVGPAGVFKSGAFVKGRHGNAIKLTGRDLDAVVVEFTDGEIAAEGCVEFWAKIFDDDDRFGDSVNPLFFTLADSDGRNAQIRISLNDGGGRYGLCGYAFGAATGYNPGGGHYTALLNDPTGGHWHHYAISWGKNPALYLDGRRVATLHGDCYSAAWSKKQPFKLILNQYIPGERYHNPNYWLIDDLKIWNYPKSDFICEHTDD